MKKNTLLMMSVSTMIFLHACQSTDRSAMGTVRLKANATTDSIEFVVKEMLVAISTNDIEKARYHVLEEGRVFRIRKDGMSFRSNFEFFKQTADQSTNYYERMWDPIIMYRGDLAVH